MLNDSGKQGYLKNVLVLAYLGDAVFNLLTRNFLVKTFDFKANQLNKMANSIVCAKNQAEIMKELKNELYEDESDIVMRARNSHLNSKAKNSTLEEYSLATQFEAVVGYWYFNNNHERINEIFNKYVVERL